MFGLDLVVLTGVGVAAYFVTKAVVKNIQNRRAIAAMYKQFDRLSKGKNSGKW